MKSFLRPSNVLKGLTVLSLVLVSTFSLTYTNNPPAARTGAPGESSCTSCHSGTAVTSGTDYNNLEISTTMVNDEYVPDSTYEITIEYTESGKSKFGFSTTALKASDNTPAGDFALLSTTTTGLATATVNSRTREYVHQKSSGTAGSGKIDWTFEWKAPSKNEGDVKLYVALNSSNSNSNTSGDKIVLKNFTIPPSSRLPKADINPAALFICQGDTLYVDGSGSKNATSYKWKTNGGTQRNLTDSALKIVWKTSGKKNVKLVVENALGASEEEVISVTVLPKPTFTVTQTDSAVCFDESIFLEATGSAVSSWKWNTQETTNKIEVLQTGTYSVEATGNNGCKATSKDYDLTILPRTSVTLSTNGRDTFCTNEQVVLSVSTELSSLSIIDKALPVAMGSDTNRVSFTVPPGPYSFTAEGIDTFGCDINPSVPFDVFVSPQLLAPVANCAAVKTESLSIEWLDDPAAKGYELSLDSGKTWIKPNGSNGLSHEVTGLTFGTEVNFRLRAKVFTFCNYSEETQLNCKTRECFKVVYDLRKQDGCAGDSARLFVQNLDTDRYSLSFDAGTYETKTRYAIGGDTGTYKVDLSFIDSEALSCPSVDTSIELRINENPKPVSLVQWQQRDGANVICSDTALKELRGNTMQGDIPFEEAVWKGEGVTENEGKFEFDPSAVSGTSALLGYVVTGIGACKDSVELEVQLDPAKEVSFTTNEQGRNVSFDQTVTGATAWKWYFGDGDSSTLENPTHYYNQDGNYTVELRTEDPDNVCPDVSTTQTLDLVGDGINYVSLRADVYPVPFNDHLSIQLEDVSKQYHLRIYDAKGNVVFEKEAVAGAETFDLSYLSQGVFLLYVGNDAELMTQTIVKQ